MPDCHLSVDLRFLGEHRTGGMQNKSRWVYISCVEDLPEFCKNLFYYGMQNEGFNEMLDVQLDIQDPLSPKNGPAKAVQESLLLPFAILKDLQQIETGRNGIKPNNVVEKKLRGELERRNPSAADYLENATILKDEGNEALKVGDYARSVRLYINAYEAMHINVIGRRFRILLDGYFIISPLTGGIYKGQRGDLVRHRLGSCLNWNLIQAYLKLEDWNQAYTWAERAISDFEYNNTQQAIMDGTPPATTDVERAKVYYRMALACKGLEKYHEADRNLIKARVYAPRDRIIEKEQEEIVHTLEDMGEKPVPVGARDLLFGSYLGR